MSTEQCWSLQSGGRRCVEPAEPPTHFCAQHNRRGGGTNPSSIWRAPKAQMPPDLVAAIRTAAPEATFPPPAPAPDRASAPGGADGAFTLSEGRPAPAGTPRLDDPHQRGMNADPDDLQWLQATLRRTITEVAESDAPPLQKANAIGRLAGQCLKTYQLVELKRANKELARRLAAAEAQLAELEARAAAPVPPATEPPPRQPLLPSENAGEAAAAASPLGSMAGAPFLLQDPSRALGGLDGPAGGSLRDGPDGRTTIPELEPASRGAPR
jgi:hypothetical protein